MASTCLGAETYPDVRRSQHRMDREFSRFDETIAMAAVYAGNHLERVAGMVCLTESGTTALRMSRLLKQWASEPELSQAMASVELSQKKKEFIQKALQEASN